MNPVVSVVIPFCLNENQPYLDLCLSSLLIQREMIPFEVVVVSSAKRPPRVPDPFRLYHHGKMSTFAKQVNLGVSLTDKSSKYIFIGGDDIVFCKHTLTVMAETIDRVTGPRTLLNAFSNCEMGRFYSTLPPVVKDGAREVVLKAGMEIGEISGFESAIMNYPLGPDFVFPLQHLGFYGTMIPRRAWNEIGEIDEEYRCGFEDQDYCYRAIALGYQPAVTLKTFLFHFGSVSVGKLKDNDTEHNQARFDKKFGHLTGENRKPRPL